jgi:hypothetical protein
MPRKPDATPQPCTLKAYAKKKKVPVEFLEELGLSDFHYMGKPAVRISYLKGDGSEGAVRFRLALEKSPQGDSRFRWHKGSKPCLYGLWQLEQVREAGYVFLVEGESDCHTLWHYGFPALGVPGASSWRGEWADALDGIEKIYALVEPDPGGEAFWKRLAASSLRERLHRLELEASDGSRAKDASELYLMNPEGFEERIILALGRAVPWQRLAHKEAQERGRTAWTECEQLALAPDILDRFEADLRRCGVAGEGRVAKILYLAMTSRLLERIVSVAVKGPSSAGKSYLVEWVLRFFPERAYHALTAMGEKTLAYSEEPIRHRFLVLYEAAGMSSDFQTYLIRSLLSEGRLRYETVEKTTEGLSPSLRSGKARPG